MLLPLGKGKKKSERDSSNVISDLQLSCQLQHLCFMLNKEASKIQHTFLE